MMDHKQALEALLVKVEAGEAVAADFEPCLAVLDFGLAWSAYHGSLDAAKALHDAVLPGWWFAIDGALASVSDMNDDDGPFFNATVKGNPARAWLCAILKALIAMEGV